MSITSRITSAPDPGRALSYWQGRRRSGNEIPGLLFLFLALVALVSFRNGRLPTATETATLGLFAGLIVFAGMYAPHLVTLFLVALLIAGVLGFAGPVSGVLASVNTTLQGLGVPLSGGPGPKLQ
ncbi:MAG: hypothetical protein ACRDGQ_09700 [Candidatus Limnocylindrales bacterium]